jgi:small subunit ribosomal protein S9
MATAVKEKKIKKVDAIMATGRRKTSVARVVIRKGTGKIIINEKIVEEYFPKGNYVMIVNQPLKVIDFKNDLDFIVNVYGGGMSGQAGAIRHSISRALVKLDANNKKLLKAQSLMTRDPRMVERKKYGQKKARKRFQFSKR